MEQPHTKKQKKKKKSKEGDATPSDPSAAPPYPVATTPSYPGAATPTYPGAATPTYPGATTPTYPGATTPTYPGTATPTYPGPTTNLGTATPPYPGANTTPTYPGATTKPTYPGTTTAPYHGASAQQYGSKASLPSASLSTSPHTYGSKELTVTTQPRGGFGFTPREKTDSDQQFDKMCDLFQSLVVCCFCNCCAGIVSLIFFLMALSTEPGSSKKLYKKIMNWANGIGLFAGLLSWLGIIATMAVLNP